MTESSKWHVYILNCSDKAFYVGVAKDIASRIETYNRGKAAKYTRGRRPVRLVFYEAYETRGEALRWECRLERLKRMEKEKLVERFPAEQLRTLLGEVNS